jgi:hypothetical protein
MLPCGIPPQSGGECVLAARLAYTRRSCQLSDALVGPTADFSLRTGPPVIGAEF